ncbi:MAG: hypothetical protein WA005_15675 [Candidatus Binataceae bacterium]
MAAGVPPALARAKGAFRVPSFRELFLAGCGKMIFEARRFADGRSTLHETRFSPTRLNSPYEEPAAHWHIEEDKVPEKRPGRREARLAPRATAASKASA